MSVELISWRIKEWKYTEKYYELCELEGQTSDVYVISDSKLILNEPWKKNSRIELNTEIAIKQRSFTKRGNLLYNYQHQLNKLFSCKIVIQMVSIFFCICVVLCKRNSIKINTLYETYLCSLR